MTAPSTSSANSPMLREYLSPLLQWLRDENLTEICINRPDELWIEDREGWKSHPLDMSFRKCMHLARLVATHNNKAVTENSPVFSGSLPEGERIQVIIPPACTPGTVSFTIRKPSMTDMTLADLESQGAFAECTPVKDDLQPFEHRLMSLRQEGRISEFLDLAVRNRRNILIAGKTGSGKTTLTRSLIRCIPQEERLVTIEDVHELFLRGHQNKVHLFYARDDEAGSRVTPKQALASCLRMKPDRILLAELRGDESWEYIKSVNTGHPGSISTIHANGAWETFEQLTALVKDSPTGSHLDTAYIRHRLFSTIDIVLFCHQRKLREIWYEPEYKRQQMA